jgi:hypothetical protein
VADNQSEEKKHIIPTAKNLFEPKHSKLISNPLGLFLWLVDRTTKEVRTEKGEVEGKVLGGMPIEYKTIATIFNCTEKTVMRWKGKLEEWKYIRTDRTSHQGSLRWTVRKSKKFKNAPTEQRTDVSSAPTEQRTDVSSPKDRCVQSKGQMCPTQLEMQRDSESITTTTENAGLIEAGRKAEATTSGEQRTDVSSAMGQLPIVSSAPQMLQLFMDTFGFTPPPNPTWLAKMQTVVAQRGPEQVTEALRKVVSSTKWMEFMQNADDAMQVFVKCFDKLLALRQKKVKLVQSKSSTLNDARWGGTGNKETQTKGTI